MRLNSTLNRMLSAVTVAGAFAAPSLANGLGDCLCGSDVINCINQGGEQYDCALGWVKKPCFELGTCWNLDGPNILFSGNGIGGAPAIPFLADASIIEIPIAILDPQERPYSPGEIASLEAEVLIDYEAEPLANLTPSVFVDADGNHFVLFETAFLDSSAGAVLLVSATLPDGSSGQGLVVIVPNCPGDLNFDGVVDAGDLSRLLNGFGNTPGGDLNADGLTDGNDLGILLNTFGNVCP